MSGNDLLNAQFGKYGGVVIDVAAGEVTGPFCSIDIKVDIKIVSIDFEGWAPADEAKLVAAAAFGGTLYGKINSIEVSAGLALAYRAKNDQDP